MVLFCRKGRITYVFIYVLDYLVFFTLVLELYTPSYLLNGIIMHEGSRLKDEQETQPVTSSYRKKRWQGALYKGASTNCSLVMGLANCHAHPKLQQLVLV